MWLTHWNLERDPFPATGGPVVALASQDRAVARLVRAIESGERRADLVAPGGMGKGVVLRRTLDAARAPGRRVATSAAPADLTGLLADLARSLRLRIGRDETPAGLRRSLADAARLIGVQRGRLLFVVDGVESLRECRDREALDRLTSLDPSGEGTVQLLISSRPADDPDEAGGPDPDSVRLTLSRWSRAEVSDYLSARLRRAGREAPAFTRRAEAVLQAVAEGIPRRVGRLAGEALRDAATAGLDLVDEDIIEALADPAVPRIG